MGDDDGRERLLRRLARLYGVQTRYRDVTGRWQQARPEALGRLLRALGAELDADMHEAGLRQAIAQRCRELRARLLEPVSVAWDGRHAGVLVRLPPGADAGLRCELEYEDGARRAPAVRIAALPCRPWAGDAAGQALRTFRLRVEGPVPPGYHRLHVVAGRQPCSSLMISAPSRCFEEVVDRRRWGVFLPLYALRTRCDWGIGDFGGLAHLAQWVGGLGGRIVATLPLLSVFLDELFQPSPYVPVSRLHWNEAYIDVTAVPELHQCPAARQLVESPAFQARLAALRSSELVDYAAVMALKRQVLERLAGALLAGPSLRREQFEQFLAARPGLRRYAAFRAVCERQHRPWHEWPEPLRGGRLEAGDGDPQVARYHEYVQWIAHQQLQDAAQRGRAAGVELYLDLPLGVNPAGYDAWVDQDLYLRGVATGAPPDPLFIGGQNWGFAPAHPERLREQGYRPFVDCLRHHMSIAGMLRIDHVMGLHRLFCIPDGVDAPQGIYLRYRMDELLAIVCLESVRHRCRIAGENLGTVPQTVDRALREHGLARLYVLPFELTGSVETPLRPPAPDSIAALNTHDTFPFAGWLRGRDIETLETLGHYDPEAARRARGERELAVHQLTDFFVRRGDIDASRRDPADLLRACLRWLAKSPAELVLVNLEDVWLEQRAQNLPGTAGQHPNWCRKAAVPLEEFSPAHPAADILREVDAARRSA